MQCIPQMNASQLRPPERHNPWTRGEGEIEMTHDNGPQTDMQGGQGRVRAQGKHTPTRREGMHANHLNFHTVHQAHEQNKMRPVYGTVKARLNSWTTSSITYIQARTNAHDDIQHGIHIPVLSQRRVQYAKSRHPTAKGKSVPTARC